jgi:putative SOS response-associated peptidase YedK
MCGRFTLAKSPEKVSKTFNVPHVPDFPSRYNIAPSQPVGVVLQDRDSGKREYRLMLWGLVPSWSKDPAKSLINARAETVAEKPSFRTAFKYRRCLIPADGFYEWQKVRGASKQPFHFSMANDELFALAGIWEAWNDIESFTILTTTANALLEPIHERMPVILRPEDYERWLDPDIQDAKSLSDLFEPFPDEPMQAIPVSTRVNSTQIDDALCVELLKKE